MNKKSKKLIILLYALLILTAVATCSYTYAKYITEVKGGGQAEIAKWSFKVGKESEEIQSIKLVNTVNKDSLINNKIAPGTSGQFFINLDGTGSEVGIDFDIKFVNEKNKPKNITFSFGGKKYNSLSEIKDIKGIIELNDSSKTRRIPIAWSWNYETGTTEEIASNDVLDTQDAVANLDYSFDVVVTGTQSR